MVDKIDRADQFDATLWQAEYDDSNSAGMNRLEIIRNLLSVLDQLAEGATLDDLRDHLKSQLVEAALVKEPDYSEPERVWPDNLNDGTFFGGPINTPTRIETKEDFIKAFGSKAGL